MKKSLSIYLGLLDEIIQLTPMFLYFCPNDLCIGETGVLKLPAITELELIIF